MPLSSEAPDAAAVTRARWRLVALAVVLTGVAASLLAVLALNARELGDRLDALGVTAILAIAPLGAGLIVAMVPASLVAGAAGFAVGARAGIPSALGAAVLGAVLCAAVGRHAGTPAARHALGPRVAGMVAWLDARPRRAVVTSRLVPGLPFNATSYALGFTGIAMRDVAVGTAIGFAPRCFAYVALGGSLRNLDAPEARLALGVSALLAVLVVAIPRAAVRRGGLTEPNTGGGS